MNKPLSTRDGFGQGLLLAGKNNQNVVVLTADLTDSTRCTEFKKAFSDRFFEVGIAEQNMMGIAAGLALSGKIPFVTSYAVFSPGRNWEQIRLSVCYSKTNVKIVGSHAGIHTGPDGTSHQATEDIALTRCLPNLVVLAPADALEAQKATLAAAVYNGPVYLRLTHNPTPLLTKADSAFTIGRADILKAGKDITLIGSGPILTEVLLAAKNLKTRHLSAEVINLHTIKPLDQATILKSIKKTKRVITVEDHQIMAGMGSAVCEFLSQTFPVPIKLIGLNDCFGQSGKPQELWQAYHLTAEFIVKAALELINRPSNEKI